MVRHFDEPGFGEIEQKNIFYLCILPIDFWGPRAYNKRGDIFFF